MTKRSVFLIALGLGVSLSGLLVAGPSPVHGSMQTAQENHRAEMFDLRSWAAYHEISVHSREEGRFSYCMQAVGGCVSVEAASLLYRELFHRTGDRNYLHDAIRIRAQGQVCSKKSFTDLCLGFQDLLSHNGCSIWGGKSGFWCNILQYSMGDGDCSAAPNRYDYGEGYHQLRSEVCAGIRAVLRHQSCDGVSIDRAQFYCRALYPIFYPDEGTTECYFTTSYISRMFNSGPEDLCQAVKKLGLKEYYEFVYQP